MRARTGLNDRQRAWARLAVFALCSASLFIAHDAAAQKQRVVPEARIESARGVALGTGSRATSAATQAQADNPANIVSGGVYHIETLGSYSPTFKRLSYGGAVVDSMTSKLAAGFSARGLYGDNDAGENSGWEGRLTLAVPIGEMLSIGLAGRYANFTISDHKAKPERPPVAGSTEVDQTFKLKGFTMDGAVTLRLSESFQLSALIYNFIDTDTPLAPFMVGGSAGFSISPGFTLGGDVLVDLNTHDAFNGVKLQAGGGVEYLASGTIPLRIGYQYDQGRHQNSVTGGLGYVDQRFGAQISVRQAVSGVKETNLFLTFSYFVQ
jgi:hypothetical protein